MEEVVPRVAFRSREHTSVVVFAAEKLRESRESCAYRQIVLRTEAVAWSLASGSQGDPVVRPSCTIADHGQDVGRSIGSGQK